ncbi:hypothetical protein Hanom_Chr04g00322991 [Helianthus anomalus]
MYCVLIWLSVDSFKDCFRFVFSCKAEMVYGFAALIRDNVRKSLVKTSGIVWGLDKKI